MTGLGVRWHVLAVAAVVGFLIATSTLEHDDPPPALPPATTPEPVNVITPEQVTGLVDALEALEPVALPPEAEQPVAEAREVLEAIQDQELTVTPTTPPPADEESSPAASPGVGLTVDAGDPIPVEPQAAPLGSTRANPIPDFVTESPGSSTTLP